MSGPIVPFLPGHQVVLLENGAEFFPALIAAIDQARFEFWLETYIFDADEAGTAVIAALVRAAQRGVAVRVLVDGFGSFEFIRDHAERLRAAGVAVQVYRPVAGRGGLLRPTRMRRLHRKLACCDGVVAFVGGINIVSDFRRQPEANPRFPRWDYALQLEGPVAAEVRATMARLWRLVAWATRRGRVAVPREAPLFSGRAGPFRAALVLRDSFRHRREIEASYLRALAGAKEEVWIVCAYFFPGRRFRHALEACARRGVRVRLVLQGLSDHPILHYATRSLYPWLLENGIELFEYTRAMMHAKVAVVDRRFVTVGSSNIDPFSLFLAREANAWVDDRALATELVQRIERQVAEGGEPLTCERVRRLPWHRRVMSWVVLFAVRVAIGWAGIRHEMEG
ncbi:cardiolipin synthase ClsB [Hydrogenophilus islandicus]